MPPRTFTVVTTVQDPLTANRLVEVLTQAGLEAFHRARGAASTDGFAAATPGFWELLVASEGLEKAVKLVEDELTTIEDEGEQNARAAEEEALSGEHPLEKP